MNSAVENIVRECVKALGYEAVSKIVNSMNTEKPKEQETKKRIARMTPTISNQLKEEFSKADVKHEDKEFDKVKKEFVSFVNGLSGDEFSSKKMEEHMKDFVHKNDEQPPKEEKPKRTRKQPAKKEKEEEKELEPPSNLAKIEEVSLKELQSIKKISTPAGPKTGIYWDGDSGRWVQLNQDEDCEDEDVVEMGFKKQTYMVGEKSGRIYTESEYGGPDIFQGFVGVGEFKEMTMPSKM